MKDPLASWPTVVEGARQLGISKRSMQLKIARHEVTIAKRPTVGKKATTVIDPADITRLKTERTIRPAVLPEESTAVVKVPVSAIAPAAEPDITPAAQLAFLSAAHLPLWLSIDQASAYTGVAKSVLRDLTREGKVRRVRGPRGFVLNRGDLERYSAAAHEKEGI